jgi:hypothetical protein
MARVREQDLTEDVKAILRWMQAAMREDRLVAFGNDWFRIGHYTEHLVLGGVEGAAMSHYEGTLSLTIGRVQHNFVLHRLRRPPQYPKAAE